MSKNKKDIRIINRLVTTIEIISKARVVSVMLCGISIFFAKTKRPRKCPKFPGKYLPSCDIKKIVCVSEKKTLPW